ncbi:hypothetical protein A2U01_0084760, partial [Trifolium medium]|nr:hypothetical protein [Trifolium medium]
MLRVAQTTLRAAQSPEEISEKQGNAARRASPSCAPRRLQK